MVSACLLLCFSVPTVLFTWIGHGYKTLLLPLLPIFLLTRHVCLYFVNERKCGKKENKGKNIHKFHEGKQFYPPKGFCTFYFSRREKMFLGGKYKATCHFSHGQTIDFFHRQKQNVMDSNGVEFEHVDWRISQNCLKIFFDKSWITCWPLNGFLKTVEWLCECEQALMNRTFLCFIFFPSF